MPCGRRNTRKRSSLRTLRSVIGKWSSCLPFGKAQRARTGTRQRRTGLSKMGLSLAGDLKLRRLALSRGHHRPDRFFNEKRDRNPCGPAITLMVVPPPAGEGIPFEAGRARRPGQFRVVAPAYGRALKTDQKLVG